MKWFYRPEDPGKHAGCSALPAAAYASAWHAPNVLPAGMSLVQTCALRPPLLAAGIPGGRKAFHGERELYKRYGQQLWGLLGGALVEIRIWGCGRPGG